MANAISLPNFSRLSAVQEKGEARTDPYQKYGEVSTAGFAAALCQEFGQAGRLCRLAGQNGGGVW